MNQTAHTSAQTLSISARRICLVLALMSASGSAAHAQANSHRGDHDAVHDNGVQTQMRNVMYHFSRSIAVHIKSLDGEVVPVDPSGFPAFDNKDSFRVLINSTEITVSATDLANALNSYVFARGNAPLSGISVAIQNGQMKIEGRLHKLGVIPFETDSVLSPTSDGKILLHAAKVKALHVPVKKDYECLRR